MIATGYTDQQIMENKNIPRRTFYYYKKKLYQQTWNIESQKTVEDLMYDKDLLKQRLTRLFASAELKANDPQADPAKCAMALAIGKELAISLFKLESDGISAVRNHVINRLSNRLGTTEREPIILSQPSSADPDTNAVF